MGNNNKIAPRKNGIRSNNQSSFPLGGNKPRLFTRVYRGRSLPIKIVFYGDGRRENNNAYIEFLASFRLARNIITEFFFKYSYLFTAVVNLL